MNGADQFKKVLEDVQRFISVLLLSVDNSLLHLSCDYELCSIVINQESEIQKAALLNFNRKFFYKEEKKGNSMRDFYIPSQH